MINGDARNEGERENDYHQGVNLLANPGQFTIGVPYAAASLAILGRCITWRFFTVMIMQVNIATAVTIRTGWPAEQPRRRNVLRRVLQ